MNNEYGGKVILAVAIIAFVIGYMVRNGQNGYGNYGFDDEAGKEVPVSGPFTGEWNQDGWHLTLHYGGGKEVWRKVQVPYVIYNPLETREQIKNQSREIHGSYSVTLPRPFDASSALITLRTNGSVNLGVFFLSSDGVDMVEFSSSE